MTNAEIDLLYTAAQAELNANETAMLVSPLALADLIEMLRSAREKIVAIGSYDELRDA